MQKHFLLHTVGVAALSLLCACGTPSEEVKTSTTVETKEVVVQPTTEVPSDAPKTDAAGTVAQTEVPATGEVVAQVATDVAPTTETEQKA